MSTANDTIGRPKPTMQDLLRASRMVKRVKQHVKHDDRETIENKARRWQHSRTPELPPAILAVSDYDPRWPALFGQEQARIHEAFQHRVAGRGDRDVAGRASGATAATSLGVVEHIGSTSIPGLAGKPMLDLLVSVAAPVLEEQKIEAFAALGYKLYGNSPCDPEASWLWKVGSDCAFVIHLCALDNPWIHTAVNFRDYMRTHPADCAAYEACKKRLSADGSLNQFEYSMEKLILWYEISVKANAWAREGARGS